MIELEAKGVSYTYQSKHQQVDVVRNVSFQVASGSFCAIIGKSGSGKSTLLSLMAGLECPRDGQILVNGSDLRTMDADLYRRKQMPLIYQNYNLFPLLTVQENVAYPLILNHISKAQAMKQAAQALEKVGLSESYWKRLPSMLSGGEQQRVAIARTLANQAELILADEPTGNLDAENSAAVVSLLRNLAHQEKKCVVVVTHDLEIAKLADRVFKMQSGQIEEEEQ